jgi:hypothetical protein
MSQEISNKEDTSETCSGSDTCNCESCEKKRETEGYEEILNLCGCTHRLPNGRAPNPIPKEGVQECYNIECMACAQVLCPEQCELHTHHDGCTCEM